MQEPKEPKSSAGYSNSTLKYKFSKEYTFINYSNTFFGYIGIGLPISVKCIPSLYSPLPFKSIFIRNVYFFTDTIKLARMINVEIGRFGHLSENNFWCRLQLMV